MAVIPQDVEKRYRFKEWNHALAILMGAFPEQWQDILVCLRNFCLKKSAILAGGGGLSTIAQELDGWLHERGWGVRHFNVSIKVDQSEIEVPTHKVDNFKGGVAVEVEWNNKT